MPDENNTNNALNQGYTTPAAPTPAHAHVPPDVKPDDRPFFTARVHQQAAPEVPPEPKVDHLNEIALLCAQLSTGPSPSGSQTIAGQIETHLNELKKDADNAKAHNDTKTKAV